MNYKVNGFDLRGLATRGSSEKTRALGALIKDCLLYTSPSPRDRTRSRMPSSA